MELLPEAPFNCGPSCYLHTQKEVEELYTCQRTIKIGCFGNKERLIVVLFSDDYLCLISNASQARPDVVVAGLAEAETNSRFRK